MKNKNTGEKTLEKIRKNWKNIPSREEFISFVNWTPRLTGPSQVDLTQDSESDKSSSDLESSSSSSDEDISNEKQIEKNCKTQTNTKIDKTKTTKICEIKPNNSNDKKDFVKTQNKEFTYNPEVRKNTLTKVTAPKRKHDFNEILNSGDIDVNKKKLLKNNQTKNCEQNKMLFLSKC